jgi:hypothetical protein
MDRKFWWMVEISDGCWLWRGTTRRGPYSTYGAVKRLGRMRLAHRYSWLMENGDPGDKCVLHRCDVSLCVRPSHLFLGTHQENMDDMKRKGRQSFLRGERSPNARLTLEQARAIKSSDLPTAVLAAQYGVVRTHIQAIRRGYRWSEVPGRHRAE